MNPILKNILAAIVGIVVGSIVNMSLIELGHLIFPLPEGIELDTMESYAANIDRFSTGSFLMTFLAHALGTLAGAFVAFKIAANNKAKFAYGIGICFLMGGIYMVYMVGGPTWFIAMDLIVAYIPMAWLAIKLGGRKS